VADLAVAVSREPAALAYLRDRAVAALAASNIVPGPPWDLRELWRDKERSGELGRLRRDESALTACEAERLTTRGMTRT
jgi:hypothetical protein